jgi:hypothetical protein
MKLFKTIFTLAACMSLRVLSAQVIYIVGNPKNCENELSDLIQEVYFSKTGLNASKIRIRSSLQDYQDYNKPNLPELILKNNKKWLTELSKFIETSKANFRSYYETNQITNSLANVDKATKSSPFSVYYLNPYNDNNSKPIRWIAIRETKQLKSNLISSGQIKKPNFFTVINGVGQNISINSGLKEISIMRGSLLEINGYYNINIGRPIGLEYKVRGITSDWQEYHGVNNFALGNKEWKLNVPGLTELSGVIEVRLKCISNVYSNVLTFPYKVLREPKIDLLFPENYGQLANCTNNDMERFYVKIRSNLNPSNLQVRIRKVKDEYNNQVTREMAVECGSYEIKFEDESASSRGVRYEESSVEKGVYCLYLGCSLFFKENSNDDSSWCHECIDPFDLWELDFRVYSASGLVSEWTKSLITVSLVSFQRDGEKVLCTCQ